MAVSLLDDDDVQPRVDETVEASMALEEEAHDEDAYDEGFEADDASGELAELEIS